MHIVLFIVYDLPLFIVNSAAVVAMYTAKEKGEAATESARQLMEGKDKTEKKK